MNAAPRDTAGAESEALWPSAANLCAVPDDPRDFLTTRWSLVLAAGSDEGAGHEALAELCRRYWYPLYAFLRRRGHAHATSEDLVQGFFAKLLERRDLAAVAPEKGRFRAFLLASIKHFEANERERERALKRGGGRVSLSVDLAGADERYRAEPAHDRTPERVFERAWALDLLERTLAALGEEYAAGGRGRVFEALAPALSAGTGPSHAELGEALGMTAGAVKVALHRLRWRYRDRLRAEIAETVADEDQVEGELRLLLEALGN